MGYRLNGFSTPMGGVSWENFVTEKERIQYLFFYLESKRILTNPISMEVVGECIDSVLEIKSVLEEITKDVRFSEKNLNSIRQMISGCNDFLNNVRETDYPRLIYKNKDRWGDLRFDTTMKSFREAFKQPIKEIGKQTGLTFKGHISDTW